MLNRKFSLILVMAVLLGVTKVGLTAPKPPDMSVLGNAVTISDGDTSPSTADHTDFGTIDTGNTLDRTYTILNSGTGQLTFSDVTISGSEAADYTVTVQPVSPLAKNATSTFTVRFTPSAGGLRYAIVSIANNSDDARNPYTFDIQGTGNVSLTIPTVTTNTFSSITANTATLGATITADGGDAVTERGVVWNTSGSPTTGDNVVSQTGSWTAPPDVIYTLAAGSLTAGTQIYFRGYAINSAGTAYVSSDSTFWTEPDTAASNITFPVTGADSMTVNWQAGSGDGVIVLVKKDAPVDSAPVDGTAYTGDSDYTGVGSTIGSGNYVLYIGTANSVAVTNLTPGGVYHIAVYEYAGAGTGPSGINYLQSGAPTNSQLIVGPPSATTVSSSNVTQNTADLQITVASDGGGTITQHGTMFNITGPPINENQTTLGTYSGGIPGAFSDSASGLPASSLIYFRGYVTNGDGTDYSDDGTFYTEPDSQATSVTFSNVTDSSMQVNWLPGSGSGSIVIIKAGSTPDATPIDGTLHPASAVYADAGAEIGTANYVVYRGSGTSVNVTDLAPGIIYYILVYEYMGAGSGPSGVNYRLDSAPGNNQLIVGMPTVTTPTVLSSPAATSASLQATITNDGGDSVTERGFVWNTTGSPTTSDGKITEAGAWSAPPNKVYSLSASPLISGTKYYFRGYATNSFGTAYTSDAIFYTEPGTQASAVNFLQATYSIIELAWTRGDGDGVIVIAREGSAVNTDPVDGVAYTAKIAYGDVASEIGTGNYVIFAGDASKATVSTITPLSTYHFAVYEYKGLGPGIDRINYKLVPATGNQQAAAPPVGHNYENSITCNVCHAFHSSPIPRGVQQIATCIDNCHYPGGPAGSMSDVAVHTGDRADCGSCHEVHNGLLAESDLTTTDIHAGGVTAKNVKLVRGNTSLYQPNALEDALYQGDPSRFLGFMDVSEGGLGAPWNGICQSCHTATSHHTNNASGDHTHPVEQPGYEGKTCLDCHPHADGFAPVISQDTPCLSAACHGSATSSYPRRAILGELDFASHHLSGVTSSSWVAEDEADCKVCHMEPDTSHMNGVVDLRDPDTGLALAAFPELTRNTGSETIEADVLHVQNNFCLKCHDSDGASAAASQNPLGGGAMQPFANAGAVPNVFDQFNPAHNSHHAVRGPGNNPICVPSGTNGNVTTMVAPWNQDSTHDQISCYDCHQTNAHGSNNQRILLDPIDFDTMLTATTKSEVPSSIGTAVDAFCQRCHQSSVYNNDAVGSRMEYHGGGQNNHKVTSNPMGCMGCHGAPVNLGEGVDNGAAAGIIHGVTFDWSSTTSFAAGQTDSFMLGGFIGGWQVNGADGECTGGECSHSGTSRAGKSYSQDATD